MCSILIENEILAIWKKQNRADCTRLKIAPNKAMNTIIHLQSLNKTESVFITNAETTLELGDFKKEQKNKHTRSIVFSSENKIGT